MATSKEGELAQPRKVAIVTGAPGNLGRAVVKKFIDEGYFVAGTILPNTPSANFSEDQFEGYEVDLTNEKDTHQFIESIIEKHGSVDAAILTAGGFAMGDIKNTGIENIQAQYKLNFETAYNVARPVFVQMMKQNSGRIFLIGSKPGLDAVHGKATVAYTLAKSLIFRLAEIMNSEAKGKNVVTTVIVPSTIDTPENRKAMPDANFNNWVKAEEIANVIYHYCTEEAAAVREPVLKLFGNS